MKPYRPQKLLIEEAVKDTPLVRSLLARLPDTPVSLVDQLKEEEGAGNGDVLEVVEFRGRFIKPCPGTRFYTCCGYQILHLGQQCSLDCTYCILQAYFPSRNLRLFANLEDVRRELEQYLKDNPGRMHRFGTGEFTDSLLLDPLTRTSKVLVPFFGEQSNAVLELKTKTAQVDTLENLNHRDHTIVAWSLNPPSVIAKEEGNTATLEQRLAAARSCQEWGYRLAFHFDPLLAYPDWKRDYGDVVSRLFGAVDPSHIAWISLGALRFTPGLKPIIRRRHPQSTILNEEFVPGLDGKLRYFRDLRVELFRHLSELLLSAYKDLCIYLCMESEDIWREALGFAPAERGGLTTMLDRAAF